MMSGEVVKLRDMRQNELLVWLDLLQSRNVRCLLAPEHNQIELNTLRRNLLEAQAEIYRRASAPTAIATTADESKAMAEKCEPTDEEVVKWYKERARINCMCTAVFAEDDRIQGGGPCPCKCHMPAPREPKQYLLTLGKREVYGQTEYRVDVASQVSVAHPTYSGPDLSVIMRFACEFMRVDSQI